MVRRFFSGKVEGKVILSVNFENSIFSVDQHFRMLESVGLASE